MIAPAALALADHGLGLAEAIVAHLPMPDPEHRRALAIALREGRLAVVRSRIERRARRGREPTPRLTGRRVRLETYLRERGREP